MADNVNVTPGSGNTIGADEVVDATLGTVKVQYVKIMDGTLDGTTKATVNSNGLKVDGSAVTQPVSGTFFQATQPVSGTFFQATQPVSGPLTDAQLRAVAVPISASALPLPSGAATAANQTTELASLASIDSKTPTLVSGRQPVDGSAVTQPVSAASLPLPTGASTAANQASEITLLTSINSNIPNMVSSRIPVVATLDCAPLSVTATGATGAAVTLTLPAIVSYYHGIGYLEIVAYSTAARTGGATPVIVTSTNIFGSPAWTFASAAAVGTTDTKVIAPSMPIRSDTINTATTIVCPATTGIIWRVNAFYYKF